MHLLNSKTGSLLRQHVGQAPIGVSPRRALARCSTQQPTGWLHAPPVDRAQSLCTATPAAAPSASTTTNNAEMQQEQHDTGAASSSFTHGITFTYFEVNTFHLQFNRSGARVLVDPWLVGELSFFNVPAIYRAKKAQLVTAPADPSQPVPPNAIDVGAVASETDVILITQWVDDHTHIPTLERLPKHIPIIAQFEAAERIKPLGFRNLTVMRPGDSATACEGRLRIRATPGALVGPPWSARQNDYFISEENVEGSEDGRGATLFYSPHCDFDEKALREARLGRVDLCVTPFTTVRLGGYPLLLGDINGAKLLKLLKPRKVLPLLNTNLNDEGPLQRLMTGHGSTDNLEQQLAQQGVTDVKVEVPGPPGEALAIAL